MRSFPLLLAVSVAAACSSTPTPQDAATYDAGPLVTDTGSDVVDVASNDTAQVDAGLSDSGLVDQDVDVPVVDRPVLVDLGTDSGNQQDVGFDLGTDTGAVDVGVDAGFHDVGFDTGPADIGFDVPPDVRINCAVPGAPDISCHSHADCAQCIPGAFGAIWCCAPNGVCESSIDSVCH